MSDLDRRTLPPTERRIADFRKRGEIALSKELVGAAAVIGGAIGGIGWAHGSRDALRELFRAHLSLAPSTGDALWLAGRGLVRAALPACLGALAGCVLAAAAQRPVLITPKFRGFQGVTQLFSPKAAAGRVLKASLKMAFVGGAALLALEAARRKFLAEPALDVTSLSQLALASIRRLFVYAGGALMLAALGDYLLTRRRIAARMRMTPEEAKREHREQEGDPLIRRKRRQRMRELAKRRLNVAVKGADVVLVNPTEYAVALRYQSDEDRAPRVVAKGRGPVAERIREMARAAGVPIIPEPPLTRLLHKAVPEGREIPAELYQAVAEVLAYVYRLKTAHRTPQARRA
jgi:flagellar biosynthesis protein FlhB